MKKHVSKSALIRYSLGFSGKNEKARIEHHIKTCPLCKSRQNLLGFVLEADEKAERIPRTDIRSAVLIEARKLETRPVTQIRLYKTAAVILTALTILFTGAYFSLMKEYRVPVDLTVLKPDINGSFSQIESSKKLHEGSVAATDTTAAAQLEVGDKISIKLRPSTSVHINKAHSRILYGRAADFSLEKGSILVEHFSSMDYESIVYRTDIADFTPLGTVFILSVDTRAATLILKEGKIKIDIHSSGDSILATAGNIYKISGNNLILRNADSEINLFSTFFEARPNSENESKGKNGSQTIQPEKIDNKGPGNDPETNSNDVSLKPENTVILRSQRDIRNHQMPATSHQNQNRYRKGR